MASKILVTGISGFIAKHVALLLLQKGYSVCGTIRALNKAEQVRRTLGAAGADVSRLTFAATDLMSDEGWDEAAHGCAGVIHLASPFPLVSPENRNALTPAARDGALRVLRATRNFDRIVLTSSVAAMMYRPNRPATFKVTEEDWTDLRWKALTAYIVSKTEAERAAWRYADDRDFRNRMAVINPALVLGPALDDDIGASLDVIRLMLKGAYPAVPPVHPMVCDVRDVAAIHVRALEEPRCGGRRLIAAGETLSFKEMAETLKVAFPDHAAKMPRWEMPALLARAIALFDGRMAAALPDLGCTPQADTVYATALTGIEHRPANEAVIAAGRSLEKARLI